MRLFVVSFFLVAFAGSICKVEAAEAPGEIGFTVTGFQVSGDNPLSAKAADAVLKSYTGKHSGLEGLQAASDALQSELGSRGYSFHRVVLPPQTLRDGVVKLQVVQFSLGEIKVENNRYFNDRNVLAALPGLLKGRAPNVKNLARELRLANAHPSKQLRIAFNESDKARVIDATVQVEDQQPGSFFTVLQNTGTEETGDLRLSLGYQYSNLFNRDHAVSLVYTTAPDDTDAVKQVGLSYSIPFYSVAGNLSFVYSDSNVESGIVQEFFQVSGAGTVVGLRYQHAFRDRGAYQHEAAVGYEDKLFESDLAFNGQPADADGISDVRTNPVTLTYRGRVVNVQSVLGFELTGVANQPGGSDSDEAAYSSARAGADPEWSALRYAFEYSYRFGSNWSVSLRYKGQEAGEPLVAGEQFGLGGAQSVRGFEERELLGDNGWQTNLELIAPPLGNTGITLLAFYDQGHLENEDSTMQSVEADPASAGLGLRWSWRDQLGVRADAASVLEGAGNTEDGDTALHFSLFYRF